MPPKRAKPSPKKISKPSQIPKRDRSSTPPPGQRRRTQPRPAPRPARAGDRSPRQAAAPAASSAAKTAKRQPSAAANRFTEDQPKSTSEGATTASHVDGSPLTVECTDLETGVRHQVEVRRDEFDAHEYTTRGLRAGVVQALSRTPDARDVSLEAVELYLCRDEGQRGAVLPEGVLPKHEQRRGPPQYHRSFLFEVIPTRVHAKYATSVYEQDIPILSERFSQHRIFNRVSGATTERPTNKSQIRGACGTKCVVCGQSPASVAHLLRSSSQCSELGVNWDSTNFIALCGSEGAAGTCHDMFDKFRISMVHATGRDRTHWVVVGGPNHKKHIVVPSAPHRCVLHAHYTHAVRRGALDVDPTDLWKPEPSVSCRGSSAAAKK